MDESLLLWINQDWAHPWLDAFFGWITQKATFSYPLILLILALLWRRAGKAGLHIWLLLLVAVGGGNYVGDGVKAWTAQYRPCAELGDRVRLVSTPFRVNCQKTPYGNPSTHALNFFLASTFLGFVLRSWRWGIVLGMLAAAVTVSRVYLGVHYPSQVLLGAVMGVAMGWLAALAVRRIHWLADWAQLSHGRVD